MGQCLSKADPPPAPVQKSIPTVPVVKAEPVEVKQEPPKPQVDVQQVADVQQVSADNSKGTAISEPAGSEPSMMGKLSGANGSQGRRAKQHLLNHASDITDEKRAAYDAFHENQQKGLNTILPELDMLRDIRLDEVLGEGGFAAVIKGWWRGSTAVAVKIFATAPAVANPGDVAPHLVNSKSSGDNGRGQDAQTIPSQLPAKALAEAMLSRDLSHPNIVRTFDVRCCKLSPAFFLAVTQGSHKLIHKQPSTNIEKHLSVMRERAMRSGEGAVEGTWKPSDSATSPQQVFLDNFTQSTEGMRGLLKGDEATAEDMVKILGDISSYKGMTPVWESTKEGDGEEDSESEDSGDGFGPANAMGARQGMTWGDVLKRVGARSGDWITIIIMQHANYGTLWKAIQDGIFVRRPEASVTDKRKRLRALLRTAREIATGMEHLHASKVVHGDLKPGNVLLNDSRLDARGFTALLADFGLAHIVQGSRHHSKHASGTTSYMAPELFGEGEVSHSTDLYAFGIMLWEMVHGRPSYKNLPMNQIIRSVMTGKRPAWEASEEAQLADLHLLYKWCVEAVPNRRPTAKEVVTILAEAEDKARSESSKASKDYSDRKKSQAQAAAPAPTPVPSAAAGGEGNGQ